MMTITRHTKRFIQKSKGDGGGGNANDPANALGDAGDGRIRAELDAERLVGSGGEVRGAP